MSSLIQSLRVGEGQGGLEIDVLRGVVSVDV